MVAIPVVSMVGVATTAATKASTTIAAGRATLELLILFSNIGKEVLAKLFGFLNHFRIRASGQS
jgi:hypothetical protein